MYYIEMKFNQILYGSCLEELRKIDAECVQTCVTSPPYWALRDYGSRSWFGGKLSCEHDRLIAHEPHHKGQVEQTKWKNAKGAGHGQTAITHTCSKCGAWWGQLGLEPTPDQYIRNMVEVFREVRRTLKKDGTLWVNIGDTYASESGPTVEGVKPKDLLGIPWMLALALRQDGWWLRAENIWSKPNAKPESVEDRPTRAHEHLFLLAKSQSYYYDFKASWEPAKLGLQRSRRSVWEIPTVPYPGAHFAVFPPDLPLICVQTSTQPGDVVLDPFTGSGTTLMVAAEQGRQYLGIEVNREFEELINQRLKVASSERPPTVSALLDSLDSSTACQFPSKSE